MAWTCGNCNGTRWVMAQRPTRSSDGGWYMRETPEPCHVCNAGSWPQWVEKLLADGEEVNK